MQVNAFKAHYQSASFSDLASAVMIQWFVLDIANASKAKLSLDSLAT